ncbi:hypothetical protein EPI10_006235 [Gossypium australe]|uniref:Uncharacterized protein n=1 Tax=Gossypium australe TaxID=47621 RepID=A0A5B6WQG3_9ROSI|nr:hypothetical protein EPI10_006235 [Gossypium australe]
MLLALLPGKMEGQHPREIPFPPSEETIENLQGEIKKPPKIPIEQRTSDDYAMPNLNVVRRRINRPAINTNNFEIKLIMIQMIQLNLQF